MPIVTPAGHIHPVKIQYHEQDYYQGDGVFARADAIRVAQPSSGVWRTEEQYIQRTARFFTQNLTGLTVPVIPANTYSITVFNDTGAAVLLAIGTDQQIIPSGGTHNFAREYETETPFTGAVSVTAVSGTVTPADSIIYNYKTMS